MNAPLPMGVVLRLLWLLTCLLLVAARAAAAIARRLPSLRFPPSAIIALPQDDPALSRTRDSIRARENYELMPVVDRLEIDVDWPHKTLRRIPWEERYPWRLRPAKWLLLNALRVPLHAERRWFSLDQLKWVYGILGRPGSLEHWESDAFFGSLRSGGPNPVFLQGGRSAAELREILGLTPDQVAALGLDDDDPGTDWFLVDYSKPLAGVEPGNGRHLPPCAALFVAQADQLLPRGVVLRQDEGPRVFTPADGLAWTLARWFFNCADFTIHEIVAHYLWTHVVGETFAITVARTLSWRHPVRRLLGSHLNGTIQQNANAGGVLVKDGGLFDRVFTGGDSKKRLLEWGHRAWRYEHLIFPDRVAAQKLDALDVCPMRDDGTALWSAVTRYVDAYVARHYPDEEALRADREIRSWSQELREALGSGGFPEITSLAILREVLAAVLFNPIAHTLVNSLQYEVFGCPLVAPVAVWAAMPAEPGDVTHDTLLHALPDVASVLQTVRATHGFSTRYERLGANLGRLLHSDDRDLGVLFRDDLKEVQRMVDDRNKTPSQRYWPLSPRGLSNSVDA